MYKVLFHIELDVFEPLKVAIANIKNLLKEISSNEVSIVVVANYKGPLLFIKDNLDETIHSDIIQLHSLGVKFLMCNNSLNNLNIDRQNLIKETDIVPAGILEIIQRQASGYAYVRT